MARTGQLGLQNKPLGGPTKTLAVTMLETLHQKTVDYCERNGISASGLIRDLLRQKLDEVAPEDTEP